MHGMEMDISVRYRLPILVVVSNNSGWVAMSGMAGGDLSCTCYDLWSAPTLLCRPARRPLSALAPMHGPALGQSALAPSERSNACRCQCSNVSPPSTGEG